VAESLLEVEDAAAPPEIIHRKRVAKAMERSLWGSESETHAEPLDITKADVATESVSVLAGQQEIMRVLLKISDIPEHRLSEFKRARRPTLLPSFA
jgi:hypothetical protein